MVIGNEFHTPFFFSLNSVIDANILKGYTKTADARSQHESTTPHSRQAWFPCPKIHLMHLPMCVRMHVYLRMWRGRGMGMVRARAYTHVHVCMWVCACVFEQLYAFGDYSVTYTALWRCWKKGRKLTPMRFPPENRTGTVAFPDIIRVVLSGKLPQISLGIRTYVIEDRIICVPNFTRHFLLISLTLNTVM